MSFFHEPEVFFPMKIKIRFFFSKLQKCMYDTSIAHPTNMAGITKSRNLFKWQRKKSIKI
jgi:hypothetical protein